MELKPGYKQTEVGVIPEDWEVSKLEEGISLISGHHVLARYCNITGNGFPYITGPADFPDGIIQHSKFTIKPTTMCRANDILLTVKGSGAGTLVLSNTEYCISRQLMAIRTLKWDTRFIYYLLKQDESFFGAAATGLIPGLSRSDILNKAIVAPPSGEQTAIANALSDADALIQSLTRLIAKKRQIKQGAMQTLLNPYENGRLKAGWEVKKMPEVCWFQEGPGVRNSQFTRSGVKLLNGTNIDQGELFLDKTDRYISEKEAYGWYSHFLADEGDIIIACSGITVEKFHEKVTVLRKEHLPLCMNTSTMRFKVISKELLHNYLIHFLRSRVFKEQIGGKATGSAQLNFGPSHVNAVEMALPPINEQTRITAILSDMDAEIAALEAKLAKYRQIKQGMMQNLLTGRIRLI